MEPELPLEAALEENRLLKAELDHIRAHIQPPPQPVYSLQDVNALIQENRELTAELNASQSNLAEISASNHELHRRVRTLTNELQRLRSEVQTGREEGESLRVVVQESNCEIDRLRAAIEQLENNQNDLQNQQLQEENRSLREHIAAQDELHLAARHTRNHSHIHNHSHTQDQACSASPNHRTHTLCSQSMRRGVMGELRRLVREIGRVELENRITALLQELYTDAEYRDRSNLHMQQMIARLQAALDRPHPPLRHAPSPPRTRRLEDSLARYDRLLLAAEAEQVRLAEEVAALRRENAQARSQVESGMDMETEQLIEELTLQLEQEKSGGRALREENQTLREEVVALERHLLEKNQRIKLLTLTHHHRNP